MSAEPLRRPGKPKRKLFRPELLQGINPRPEKADAFFDLADRLRYLKGLGYAVADMAETLALSSATVSRHIKASAWPKGIRARILLKAEAFPRPVLMGLARTTFKDQGSQSAKDGRKGPKSRLKIQAAVERIIEGKPLPKPKSRPLERTRHFEKMATFERGRRQALESERDELRREVESLKGEISSDKFSSALRRVSELESEVERLRLVPGAPAQRKPKSNDLQRQDDDLGSVLKCRVDTLDWSRGLLLIKAGNGDILDGLRERIILKLSGGG